MKIASSARPSPRLPGLFPRPPPLHQAQSTRRTQHKCHTTQPVLNSGLVAVCSPRQSCATTHHTAPHRPALTAAPASLPPQTRAHKARPFKMADAGDKQFPIKIKVPCGDWWLLRSLASVAVRSALSSCAPTAAAPLLLCALLQTITNRIKTHKVSQNTSVRVALQSTHARAAVASVRCALRFGRAAKIDRLFSQNSKQALVCARARDPSRDGGRRTRRLLLRAPFEGFCSLHEDQHPSPFHEDQHPHCTTARRTP